MSEDDPKVFTFGERLGMVFIAQMACLSAAAILGLLTYFITKVMLSRYRARIQRTTLFWLFMNLLFFDSLQAIGGILNIKWVVESRVTHGAACTVQGTLKNMGDVGVALSSMAIALHTFVLLVFRCGHKPWLAPTIIGAIWTLIFTFQITSYAFHKGDTYYGNTGYWCWITQRYHVQRIVEEYLFLWLSAFVSIICYIPLAFIVSGRVVVDGFKVRFPDRENRVHALQSASNRSMRESTKLALQMVFYPIVYIITVLPIAVARFTQFSGAQVPFAATAFSDILFSSSGLFNVILYTVTRPKLLPTSRHQNTPSTFSTSLSSRNRQFSNQPSDQISIPTTPIPDESDDDPTIYSWPPLRRSPPGLGVDKTVLEIRSPSPAAP